jgi:PAT family beta-lactamase induction signal transducer AmpG
MNSSIFSFSWPHLRLFFLGGIATGLPGVLTWQTLNIWLSQLGYSKSMIGLIFLSGIPYNLKIPLAWIIDKKSIPFLSPILGHRRAWAVTLQALLAIFVLIIGLTTGHIHIIWTIGLCFFISLFFSKEL